MSRKMKKTDTLYRSISTRTEQSDMMTIKFGIYLYHMDIAKIHTHYS